jgi:hypothetical protein
VGKIVPHNQEGSTVNLDQTPLTIRTKEIENDPDAPLIVPDVITKPDILTIQTRMESRKEQYILHDDTKYIIQLDLK